MGHAFGVLMLGLVSAALLWDGVQCDLTLYRISVPATVSVPEGLCVVIPCNFTYDTQHAAGDSPFYGYWYEDKKIPLRDPAVATNDPRKTIEEYARGRFNLSVEVEHGNCSLLILDARKMDAKQYYFRMDKEKAVYSYMLIKPRVEVTKLETPQIQISGKLQAGHEANLTCVAPESCFLKRPHVNWEGLSHQVKSRIPAPRVNNFRDHISVLSFIPSAADNGQELTCQVTYGEGPNPLHIHETVRLNVTINELHRNEIVHLNVTWSDDTIMTVDLSPTVPLMLVLFLNKALLCFSIFLSTMRFLTHQKGPQRNKRMGNHHKAGGSTAPEGKSDEKTAVPAREERTLTTAVG